MGFFKARGEGGVCGVCGADVGLGRRYAGAAACSVATVVLSEAQTEHVKNTEHVTPTGAIACSLPQGLHLFGGFRRSHRRGKRRECGVRTGLRGVTLPGEMRTVAGDGKAPLGNTDDWEETDT